MNTTVLALLGTSLLMATPTLAQGETKEPPKEQKEAEQKEAEQKEARPAPAMRAVRIGGGGFARKAPTQAELKERFEAKMAEPWVKKASWVTDYDKARDEAKAAGKLIFAYFTRSYAP